MTYLLLADSTLAESQTKTVRQVFDLTHVSSGFKEDNTE